MMEEEKFDFFTVDRELHRTSNMKGKKGKGGKGPQKQKKKPVYKFKALPMPKIYTNYKPLHVPKRKNQRRKLRSEA